MKQAWRKFLGWLNAVPHLFAKLTIIYCIAFASGASFYALRILSRTGADATGLLGIIMGFFGGELLLLLLKTVLKKKEDNDNNESSV